MTTREAIQAMLDWKKVRETIWGVYGKYMCFNEDTLMDKNGIYFNQLNMNLAGNGEIYEEPKPKQVVAIEKWLCETDGRYEVRESSNIEAYVNGYWKVVKLLDTYEVEL